MIPRARMLHAKIWDSIQVQGLKIPVRLLYIGLITHGDDKGRLRGDGVYLRHQIFYQDRISIKKVEKMRDAIRDAGLIEVYSDKNGTYISHPKWKTYQKLRADRTKDSEYPAPPSDICLPSDGRWSAQDKASEEKIIEGEEKDGDKDRARKLMLRGLEASKAGLPLVSNLDSDETGI